MLNACMNCAAIWSPGTEEYDEQTCSACGWDPTQPLDENQNDDDLYYEEDIYDDDDDDKLFDKSQLQ